MRRVHLYLGDDVDHALPAEAARLGVSRSALMRDAVRSWLGDHVTDEPDVIDELIGSVDIEPIDDIDAVLYDV